MKIGICASGPVSEMLLPQVDYYIGVDRGALTLLENGIVPHEMVGDFDSVTDDEFLVLAARIANVERVSSIKDETDTDIALSKAVSLQPTHIFITCVTGGRLDHQEALMRSVQRFQLTNPGIQFLIVNKQNEMCFLTAGTHRLHKGSYQYVSFFSIVEDIDAVTLTGVKYETNRVPMPRDCTLFTSNEILTQDASISLTNGICLMIKSND